MVDKAGIAVAAFRERAAEYSCDEIVVDIAEAAAGS